MVVQTLVARREPVEPPQNQGLDIMNHELGLPVVGEASGDASR